MALEQLFARLAGSAASGSRSNALTVLLYLDGLFLAALVLSFSKWSQAPTWVAATIAVMLAISFVVTLGSYVYFMFTSPDALRSESFTLRKLEIEKGIIGDNLQGITERRVIVRTTDSVGRIGSESADVEASR